VSQPVTEIQGRNTAVVRELVETLNEGGPETVLARADELYHPDIAWRGVGAGRGAPGGDTVFRGHEGMRRFYDEIAETLDELRFLDMTYRPVGEDVVIASGRIEAKTLGAGVPFEAEIHMLYEMRDGLVAGGENFYDQVEAETDAKRIATEADRAEA
jgi:ketosteroid isomerase-like protein